MSEYLPTNIDFWWTLVTGLLGGTVAFVLARTAEERGMAVVRKTVDEQPMTVVTVPGHSQLTQIETALRSLLRADGRKFDPEDLRRILEPIIKENLQLRARLESADAKLEEQACQLKSYIAQAQTDSLTGLSNRRCFDDLLERRVGERHRRRMRYSLLLIDIDHFKVFNDAFGHLAGDMVLKGVASILNTIMRDTDLVARYGGEEFAIILADSDLENAVGVAERIRTQIEKSFFCVNDSVLHVTASVGVTELQTEDSIVDVVERADAALYEAKASGRNQTHSHDVHGVTQVPMLPPAELEDAASPPESDEAEHSDWQTTAP